jgi:hypothetical protein
MIATRSITKLAIHRAESRGLHLGTNTLLAATVKTHHSPSFGGSIGNISQDSSSFAFPQYGQNFKSSAWQPKGISLPQSEQYQVATLPHGFTTHEPYRIGRIFAISSLALRIIRIPRRSILFTLSLSALEVSLASSNKASSP